MNLYHLVNIRNKFYELNSSKVFILSFLICVIFYFIEGFVGVDRYYHPDSVHYLSKYYDFSLKNYISKPSRIFTGFYYHVTNLFNDNYYFLILLNFILYSITNVFIYQKVFKKYFCTYDNLKLVFLFYILFLDPYRLHLASHILKETFLIFFMILIVLSNLKIIKILSIIIMDSIRPNSWIYILIFLTYSNIIKIIKPKIIYIILGVFILFIIIYFLLELNTIYFIQEVYESFINKMQYFYNRKMPIRSYDYVYQFKDFGFPLGFILKIIIWPLLLVSGFFIFFVSSILFKFLGIVIVLNNILIYLLTKKTFVSFGLIIVLIMISIYTSSYTAMFRYSYIAVYTSVIYFFYKYQN